MSGLTPLLDTLLASRLAQRVDLVPLKAEVQIDGPGAAVPIDAVTNDVRLPSRAAVEQEIGVGLLKGSQRGQGSQSGMVARHDPAVSLSTAARVVSTLLESQASPARINGKEPLLAPTLAQPPSAALVAATLARTVSQSGLFYESHLAQLVAGTRSLADVVQEPQARLADKSGATPTAPPLPVLPEDLGPQGMAQHASTEPKPSPVAGTSIASDIAPPAQTADEAVPHATMESTRSSDAVRAHAHARSHDKAYALMQGADASTSTGARHFDDGPETARTSPVNAPALAGIHPEALALVRQQLELLAQPVFRWHGEAWPDVPMDWEIQEDPGSPAGGDEVVARTWSTRLSLALPTLGEVEVRISLAGDALQLRLAATQDSTRDQLREAARDLPGRFGKQGLDLTGVQIASLSTPGTASGTGHAGQ